MTVIKMIGVDPSLTHTGWSVCRVDLDTRKIVGVDAFGTIVTAPEKLKQVRKSSDDMQRARTIASTLREVIAEHKVKVGASEIPSGAQSARAAISFGMAIGILASLTCPLIEVSPSEVKMAVAGNKIADKEDMVRWAVNLTKDDPIEWATSKAANDWQIHSGKGFVKKTMEHQADSIAAVHAAIKSEQFRQLSAMMVSLI